MTEDEFKKLHGYYHSLLGYERVLNKAARPDIASSSFRPFAQEIHRLQADFPGFLPPFAENEFLEPVSRLEQMTRRGLLSDAEYDVMGVRGYLAMTLGRIKAALDTTESTPVTETREFLFVQDAALRAIIERDYKEIQHSAM